MPLSWSLQMAPIFVFGDKSDTGIGDFPRSHFVGPIVYLDPPFATMRSAQVPLIASVNTFRFGRLKTTTHAIEHFLRRRIRVTGSGGCCCTEANPRSDPTYRNKEEPLSFQLLAHFVIRL